MPPFWEIGCVGVEVAVDESTGRHPRRATRHGRRRRLRDQPALVEGQDIGAATMGLGMATPRGARLRAGNLLNGNLFDYRVPRVSDAPTFDAILVEHGDGIGGLRCRSLLMMSLAAQLRARAHL